MKQGAPFLVLGFVFIALGASGRNAYLALGVVFLAIGAGMQLKRRK
jgi:hypothetical protein